MANFIGKSLDPPQRVDDEVATQSLPLLGHVHRKTRQNHYGNWVMWQTPCGCSRHVLTFNASAANRIETQYPQRGRTYRHVRAANILCRVLPCVFFEKVVEVGRAAIERLPVVTASK